MVVASLFDLITIGPLFIALVVCVVLVSRRKVAVPAVMLAILIIASFFL